METELQFQIRIQQELATAWIKKVWPDKPVQSSVAERGLRFGEEAIECMQSCYISREQAHLLVDQVYNKPIELNISKEIGGAFATMLALAASVGVNAGEALEVERDLCDQPERIAEIQRKHKIKEDLGTSAKG